MTGPQPLEHTLLHHFTLLNTFLAPNTTQLFSYHNHLAAMDLHGLATVGRHMLPIVHSHFGCEFLYAVVFLATEGIVPRSVGTEQPPMPGTVAPRIVARVGRRLLHAVGVTNEVATPARSGSVPNLLVDTIRGEAKADRDDPTVIIPDLRRAIHATRLEPVIVLGITVGIFCYLFFFFLLLPLFFFFCFVFFFVI